MRDKIIQKLNIFYNEYDGFFLSLVFVFLYIFNSQFVYDFDDFFGSDVIIVCVFLGLFFSILHVFIKRKKTELEKKFILAFIVVINFFITIYALRYQMSKDISILYLFLPTLNFLYSFLVIIIVFGGKEPALQVISDINLDYKNISFSLIVILTIFILFNFFLKTEWFFTYSICLAYTNFLDKTFKKYFKIYLK